MVSFPALVTAVIFFVCGISGPFMIRSATSCCTSGVMVWVWLCVAVLTGLRVMRGFTLSLTAVIAFHAFWTAKVCFLATSWVP